jgi:NodT family efflux transporter outer membrane factor (OMF) lipoprotein
MARPRQFTPWAALTLLLTGCTTVGPDYLPPVLELPAQYTAPIPPLFRDGEALSPWWAAFDDPVLGRLIERGLDQNLDLRVAASRVREARAEAKGAAASTGPQVDIAGEGALSAVLLEEGGDGSSSSALIDLVLDGVYEIDLFGGRAQSRQAAWALAEQEERLSAEARRISTAEIARTYVQLRATQRLLALTADLLALQRRTLDLVRERVGSGLAPGLDQVRAEAAVATLEADLGPLRSEAEQFANALALLLAEPPGALDEALASSEGIPVVETGARVDVPAALLRRRPDVQAAEIAMLASTADVGVAAADLLPRLTLPTSLAIGPLGAGGAAAALLASVSALVDYSLYDGGEREAAVTAAEERLLQSRLLYRDTVLQAVDDVESALLAYDGTQARREALRRAVDRNRTAYRQSEQLYSDGFASFIDVLDSQRELNSSRQELAIAEQDLSLAIVDLYAALGGSQ